ncbi:antibiotic biosynthesis monooxygenase family protein [Phytohabitans sp. LJ34]|uniref:antibiotic biosynthesis monooxygenase family protein n=1 Tax=Phytohabitans sp. LJ34 TaxID=3452217 RepID=UPI003F8BCD23
MIVRTWSARATPAGAADYHAYFEGTLLPELRALAGFAGAYLLSRTDGATVELTAHTLWESLASIQAFAGDDITRAVVEPEARAVLLDIDETVTHRDVLVDARATRA